MQTNPKLEHANVRDRAFLHFETNQIGLLAMAYKI